MNATIKKITKHILLNIPGVIVAVILAIITSKFIDFDLWMLIVGFLLLYILVILIGWLGSKIFGSALIMNPEDSGVAPNKEIAVRACGSRKPVFILNEKDFDTKKVKKVSKPKREKKKETLLVIPDDDEPINDEVEIVSEK